MLAVAQGVTGELAGEGQDMTGELAGEWQDRTLCDMQHFSESYM